MFRALLIVLVLALPTFAQKEQKVEEYTSETGMFRVKFPGKAKEDAKDLVTGKGKSVPVTTVKADGPGNAVYSVTIADYAESVKDVMPKTVLDGVRDGMKGTDGKVTSESVIQFGPDKSPGRELKIDAGKNVVRAKVILVGNRLYQVMVSGSRDAVGMKAVDEFFKSFELVK